MNQNVVCFQIPEAGQRYPFNPLTDNLVCHRLYGPTRRGVDRDQLRSRTGILDRFAKETCAVARSDLNDPFGTKKPYYCVCHLCIGRREVIVLKAVPISAGLSEFASYRFDTCEWR